MLFRVCGSQKQKLKVEELREAQLEIHCLIHNSPQPVPLPSQISQFLFHPNSCRSILRFSPSVPRFYKWSLSLRSPFSKPSMHVCSMPYVPQYLPFLFFLAE